MTAGVSELLSRACSTLSFLAAWRIPGVAVYAFSLFFAKLVAYTFLYWLPYYIHMTSEHPPHFCAQPVPVSPRTHRGLPNSRVA